jgi:hypothetical protein
VAEALDRHLAEVVGEDDEVGRLADLKAALKPFLAWAIRLAPRGRSALGRVHRRHGARTSTRLHRPLGGLLDMSMVPTSGTPIGPTGIYITE